MILGPYSYLCFCLGAFVGSAPRVKPTRQHQGQPLLYIYSYKLLVVSYIVQNDPCKGIGSRLCKRLLKDTADASRLGKASPRTHPTDRRGDGVMSSIPKPGQDKYLHRLSHSHVLWSPELL